MTDKPEDPAGTTHQFKAFVNRAPADPAAASRTATLIALAAAVAVVLVVVLGVVFVL